MNYAFSCKETQICQIYLLFGVIPTQCEEKPKIEAFFVKLGTPTQ